MTPSFNFFQYLCPMQNEKEMISRILEKLNITALNKMQFDVLRASKKNKDLILLSPTGSGKTLGFLLPLIMGLDPNKSGIQAMILTPSRELALQIEQVFRSMATGFKVSCCYGGHPMKTEKNNLVVPPALLIGTPGRVADHLRREHIDPTTIHTLILDEFDKSLDLGFHVEMKEIIEVMSNLKKRILTSATAALEIPDFTGVTSPIELSFLEEGPIEALTLKSVVAEGNDKLEALFRLICKLGNAPTLVFCNHREAVERISELLADQGIVHDTFHGGLEQEQRERALIKFRNGSHHLLITTDLASRGLDIPEIQHVIHYQRANSLETFTHRNGRTARMHATGTAYLVMHEEEYAPEFVPHQPEIEELPEDCSLPTLPPWATLYIAGGRKEKINKIDIVGLILQKGKIQKDELGLIEVRDHTSYVAIKRSKIQQVVRNLRNEKLKRKKVKMEISR